MIIIFAYQVQEVVGFAEVGLLLPGIALADKPVANVKPVLPDCLAPVIIGGKVYEGAY